MASPASRGIGLQGVVKAYGSTVALAGIDFDLVPGEVTGIAGPNGAGKSTLVRIIAGEEKPTAGTLSYDGKPWSPVDDWRAVAVVHQEPQLFPNLTVAENLMVGREESRAQKPRLGSADLAVMTRMGLLPLRDRLLEDCSLATQQRIEIARAVARDCRVFLFDEPNSALTTTESDELFSLMHGLAEAGHIVVLITHRLADLVAHCARVAIVRDGRIHSQLRDSEITEDAIARRLVTESVEAVERRRNEPRPAAAPSLRLEHWSHEAGDFADVGLSVQGGEIIALMGVEGSGSRELLRSLGGIEPATGVIELGSDTGGAVIVAHSAYVPATRQLSLYSNYSVGQNLLVRLGIGQIAARTGLLQFDKMARAAADGVKRFMIKAEGPEQPIRALSGGNQQKVAIAQALILAPRLLLLEEPTRGVDIHSKSEIYRLLRDYAEQGNVVVIFCTEVLEVFEAADLVYVMRHGTLTAPLRVAEFDKVEELASAVAALDQGTSAAAAA